MKTGLSLALVGLGSAGRSRERACAEVEGIRLAAKVSRRPEMGDSSWEEVLADPRIEAIAISTENARHPEGVAAALDAGKHVLCDYPLAFGGEEGRRLFARAEEKNLVLHVEHIGLLGAEHRRLRDEAVRAGPLRTGEFLFQGGWNEKLADPTHSGPPPFLAVSRLMQVADLFGYFHVAKAESEASAQGYRLHLHLDFAQGGSLSFTEERRLGLPRRRSLVARCRDGHLTLKSGTMGGGLFAADLAWFRDRVLHGKACYYDENLMLRVLEALATVSSGQ